MAWVDQIFTTADGLDASIPQVSQAALVVEISALPCFVVSPKYEIPIPAESKAAKTLKAAPIDERLRSVMRRSYIRTVPEASIVAQLSESGEQVTWTNGGVEATTEGFRVLPKRKLGLKMFVEFDPIWGSVRKSHKDTALFELFKQHFEEQADEIGDDELEKEIKILNKILESANSDTKSEEK